MNEERRFSVIDPRLSKTGGEILASAIQHSADQGNPMATIESLFYALVNHKKVTPVARLVGIDPESLSLTYGTRPEPNGAAMLWDGEVQTAINVAHRTAQERGARRAGLVDLLAYTVQHEAVIDIFALTPDRQTDVKRLKTVLVQSQQPYRLQRIAS
jgi:ATP-dependent Clp protease ATP-binding subunit ClpA